MTNTKELKLGMKNLFKQPNEMDSLKSLVEESFPLSRWLTSGTVGWTGLIHPGTAILPFCLRYSRAASAVVTLYGNSGTRSTTSVGSSCG